MNKTLEECYEAYDAKNNQNLRRSARLNHVSVENNIRCGLYNSGNMCYMNSCMQIFTAIPEICAILRENVFVTGKTPSVMSRAFYMLMTEMNTAKTPKTPVINPQKFVNASILSLQKDNYYTENVRGQQDFVEFMQYIIEHLHKQVLIPYLPINIVYEIQNEYTRFALKCDEYKNKEYASNFSNITKLFCGLKVNTIYSAEHDTIHRINPESFSTIHLEIPICKTVTLDECLFKHFGPELMDGDNKWHNDTTGTYDDVELQSHLWELPTILTFAIKRFTYDNTKINTMIQFPHLLNMDEYIIGKLYTNNFYKLFGVCNHFGSTDNGHYTSTVYDGTKWVMCNDEFCTEVCESDVISSNAYCLFYRKCHIIP